MFTSDCQSKGAFRRQNSADGDFFLIKVSEAVNPHIDFLSLRRSDNAQKRPCGFYSARSFSCYGLKIGVAQNQALIICSSLRLQPVQIGKNMGVFNEMSIVLILFPMYRGNLFDFLQLIMQFFFLPSAVKVAFTSAVPFRLTYQSNVVSDVGVIRYTN